MCCVPTRRCRGRISAVLMLFVLVAMAVIGAVAVLVARDAPVLEDDPVPGRPLQWPTDGAVRPADIAAVRFGVAVRGYRMDQVDLVLEDARVALAERDRVIAELRAVSDAGSGSTTAAAEEPPAPPAVAEPAAEEPPAPPAESGSLAEADR